MARKSLETHDHSNPANGGRVIRPREIDVSERMIVPVVDETSEIPNPREGAIIYASGNGSAAKGIHRYDGGSWTKGASTNNGGITAGLNDNFSNSVSYQNEYGDNITYSLSINSGAWNAPVINGYLIEEADETARIIKEVRYYYDDELQASFTENGHLNHDGPIDTDTDAHLVDRIEMDHDTDDAILAGKIKFTPKTVPQGSHSH